MYGYASRDYQLAYREYTREISLTGWFKMDDSDVRNVNDAVTDIDEH